MRNDIINKSWQYRILCISTSLYLVLITARVCAQDMYTALQDYRNGRFEKVREAMIVLENTHYNTPEYLFLSAVMEQDGERAFTLYSSFSARSPDSPILEQVLWRMCQYYYAKGLYSQCSANLARFLATFPESELLESVQQMQKRIADHSGEQVPVMAPLAEENTARFVLQFGAFGSASGARRRLEYLRNLGLTKSFIKQQQVGSRILYKIWVEEFSSKNEADKMRDEYIRRYRIPDIFVVEMK